MMGQLQPAYESTSRCPTIDESPPFSHPELRVLPVSVLDDASVERLRDELWALTGLVRIYLRDGGDPVVDEIEQTVGDEDPGLHRGAAGDDVGPVQVMEVAFGGQFR